MTSEYNGTVHKKETDDIETSSPSADPTKRSSRGESSSHQHPHNALSRRHHQPLQPQQQQQQQQDDCDDDSQLHHSHNSHEQQHQQPQRCWSFTTLPYVIFVILLLTWAVLQVMLAQIHLNSNVSGQQRTTAFLASNTMNRSVEETYAFGESSYIYDFISSLVDRVRRGAIFLFGTLLLPSPKEPGGSATAIGIERQRIEDDYVFIFYLLLVINFLTMLPSWCKHIRSSGIPTREKKEQKIIDRAHNINGDGRTEEELITEEEMRQARDHRKLLRTYLPAYLLATCADWLQGPYKYALYSSYGYTQRDIAHLFVAGYGSG